MAPYKRSGSFLVLIKEETVNHVECKLPLLVPKEGKSPKGLRRIGIGSIWECSVCHKQWKVVRNGVNEAKTWELIPEDQRVKPENQSGDEDFVRKK